MFYLNSTLNIGIPPVMLFHWEVYYMVDRLLPGLAAQQKGTAARGYSNKTSLVQFCVKLCNEVFVWEVCTESFP